MIALETLDLAAVVALSEAFQQMRRCLLGQQIHVPIEKADHGARGVAGEKRIIDSAGADPAIVPTGLVRFGVAVVDANWVLERDQVEDAIVGNGLSADEESFGRTGKVDVGGESGPPPCGRCVGVFRPADASALDHSPGT